MSLHSPSSPGSVNALNSQNDFVPLTVTENLVFINRKFGFSIVNIHPFFQKMDTKTLYLLLSRLLDYVSIMRFCIRWNNRHDNGNIFHLFKLYVLKVRFSPDSSNAFSWWE
jgi:hypothetical protein